MFTEDSDSGSYYPDVGTCDDPDAVLELQGECQVIIEFDTVCNGATTSDGALTSDGAPREVDEQGSPASTAVPTLSVLALAFVAAAASMW